MKMMEITREDLGVQPNPKGPRRHNPIRFFEDDNGCFVYASGDGNIYPRISVDGSDITIARLIVYGMEGDGLVVRHSCDNRRCINPRHLFPGTHQQNCEDMLERGRHPKRQKTHCPNGHPYSGDNLYLTKQGHRCCKECHRAGSNKSYHSRKAASNE